MCHFCPEQTEFLCCKYELQHPSDDFTSSNVRNDHELYRTSKPLWVSLYEYNNTSCARGRWTNNVRDAELLHADVVIQRR